MAVDWSKAVRLAVRLYTPTAIAEATHTCALPQSSLGFSPISTLEVYYAKLANKLGYKVIQIGKMSD